MSRALASIMLGFAAYWLAIGIGIPDWRDWSPGDARDIGTLVGFGVWMAIRSARKPA